MKEHCEWENLLRTSAEASPNTMTQPRTDQRAFQSTSVIEASHLCIPIKFMKASRISMR